MGAMGNPMGNGSRRSLHRCKSGRTEAGFAYVLLLLGIAVLGMGASAALQIGAQAGRRHAEQALLFIGGEFERALYSYAGVAMVAGFNAQAGALAARGPRSLDDLLQDPRVPGVRRHLRQVYADPMTGQREWGVVRDPAGFIIGVYSLSEGQPIKQLGFDARHAHFEEAPSYAQWVFGLPMAQAQALIGTVQPAAPTGSTP